MTIRTCVVAGVDGGPDGLRAAEYAATLAVAEGRGVRLVHAYHVSAGLNPMYPYYGLPDLREFGQSALAEAERRLRDQFPDLEIEHHLVYAPAAGALVEASKDAAAVVVGRRAVRGVSRVLSGSTSSAVAAHATCPVFSVPGGWAPTHDADRIVVGADGSAQGRAAIAFAFAEASRRGAELVVVRVWEMPARWYADVPVLDSNAHEWAERAELALAEDLAGWTEDYPEVPVTKVVEHSPYTAEQLLDHSEDAALLVIGSRGHSVLPGVQLGFTARSVLAHAECAVAVIHPDYVVDPSQRVDATRRHEPVS